MEALKAYIVTKSSTDETFIVGDVVWKSENGEINFVSSCRWITPSECSEETLDFECEPYDKYNVVEQSECELCANVCA